MPFPEFRPFSAETENHWVYTVWQDTKTVILASTVYPGHSENIVTRRVKDPVTKLSVTTMLHKYNKSMGGGGVLTRVTNILAITKSQEKLINIGRRFSFI